MQAFNRRAYIGTAPDTTLSADIDDTTLTLSCADLTGWPDGSDPFEVTLEPEQAAEEKNWGTRSGNTITLLARGMEGAAVAHAGTTTVVRHGLSALDMDEANYAVSQTVGQVAAKGDLLQGTSANTLEPVTVGTTGQALVVASGKWVAGTPAVAESDVTGLVDDLATLTAGKQDVPVSGWSKGSLLVGAADGSADTLPVGAAGTVLTAQTDGSLAFATGANPFLALADYTGITGSFAGALTALNTTSLTVSFAVPASGKVLIRASGLMNRSYSGSGDLAAIGWKNHSGGATVGRQQTIWYWPNPSASSGDSLPFSRAQTITGLTAGSTLQLDLAGIQTGSGSTTISDVTIEVWAA